MLDKKGFFDKYKVENEFNNSGLDWGTLETIYDDYCKRKKEFLECQEALEKHLRENMKAPVHSIRCRAKDPMHLVEKIIRKRGKEQNRKYAGISVDNYREIVRDLIGVRILVMSKEEWEDVFDDIMSLFRDSDKKKGIIVEQPVAYTRYGDRYIFKEKIHAEHTNKGYRSQHYIVKFNGYYCEIQVRTLTEEVYGEVDHKVKYPYRENNKFLIRYANVLLELLNSVDELISACFQMDEEGWNECDKFYHMDEYIDWKNISQKSMYRFISKKEEATDDFRDQDRIEIDSYADKIIKRKE